MSTKPKKNNYITLLLIIVLFSTFTCTNVLAEDVPTGSSYMLIDNHGYTWVDAEKIPGDNGLGLGSNVGENDDALCWAATASNVLEWTGWGLVGGMWDTDAILDAHEGIWNDTGGWMDASWSWWLNGVDVPPPRKVVSGGGNWWPSDTWTDYFHEEVDQTKTMEAIDDWLHAGYGVGIFIAGHCITIWGFNYNASVDKTDPENYYLGIWMTDSDSHKGDANANDVLEYFEVEWNSTANIWYTPNLGGGMIIRRVQALEPYPSGRPDASAGGPYTVNEGTAVTFDGSGSNDKEKDIINYRWDYDYNDSWDTRNRKPPSWDTAWSSTATTNYTWNDDYSGDVLLQVNADHSLDMDKTTITVNNVAPTVDVGADAIIDEGDTFLRSGSFTDPGTDTWTATVDFGDGAGVQPLALTDKTFTLSHAYGDDGVYTVTVRVTDDDGGVGTDTITITVLNVAPTVDVGADATMDEGGTFFSSGSFKDPGTDTWTATVNYGDGTGIQPLALTGKTFDLSHVYGDNGIYTVTVGVTDDDGAYARAQRISILW